MRISFYYPLLTLLFAPGFATPHAVFAAAPVSAKAVSSLDIRAEKGLTVTKPGEETFEFGPIVAAAGAKVSHTFTLINRGKSSITLDTVLTSCHCTSAALLDKTSGAIKTESFVVEPGKAIDLNVAIDTAITDGTDFRKLVWVYVKGSDDPALTLTVVATITPVAN